MSDTCQEICEIIRQHETFLVLTHHRPDGDAIGSQLALVLLLKDLGKTVTAWNEDAVPAKFEFLPQSALVTQPPATKQDFDVVIAIDTSTWKRVGTPAAAIGARKLLVNIDHHVSNDHYGDVNWIVPDAPASGQIAFDLIRRGGFPLTRDMATCLFAAISTDTGSFSYPNTTAACLRVAAELVETGINIGEISREVYESYPYARLRMLQMFLNKLQLVSAGKVAYSWVTKQMFADTGAGREDTEGLIDNIRAVNGVLVAALFEELPEANEIRISLRSKHPRVDVNVVATRFHGGGHKEAAGARIPGAPAAVEQQVLAAINDVLREAGV